MEKTGGRARLHQLFAAVSVLGVSLGMVDAANAASPDDVGQAPMALHKDQVHIEAGDQTSHKNQRSLKSHAERSQTSNKERSSYKEPNSYNERLPPPDGQSSIKDDALTSVGSQTSVKHGAGQHSSKNTDQSSAKVRASPNLPPPGGQTSIKGEVQ